MATIAQRMRIVEAVIDGATFREAGIRVRLVRQSCRKELCEGMLGTGHQQRCESASNQARRGETASARSLGHASERAPELCSKSINT